MGLHRLATSAAQLLQKNTGYIVDCRESLNEDKDTDKEVTSSSLIIKNEDDYSSDALKEEKLFKLSQ